MLCLRNGQVCGQMCPCRVCWACGNHQPFLTIREGPPWSCSWSVSSGPCLQVLYLVVGGGYLWFIAQGPGITELGEVVMWCQESDL